MTTKNFLDLKIDNLAKVASRKKDSDEFMRAIRI